MASCFICGNSSANYRREVYLGQSKRVNYGRRITFGNSRHYGLRSVCKGCAKNVDWWSDFRVVFWQFIAVGVLLWLYIN